MCLIRRNYFGHGGEKSQQRLERRKKKKKEEACGGRWRIRIRGERRWEVGNLQGRCWIVEGDMLIKKTILI